jgi:hypothetical protein
VSEGGISTFYRPAFQGVLLKHLPRTCRTYLSKRLNSYHQSHAGPIKLVFEDGSTATCDILIGADGIKSPTRRSLLRESARLKLGEHSPSDFLSSVDPIWTGTIAYRAMIPAERLRQRAPGHRALKGGMIVGHFISYRRSRKQPYVNAVLSTVGQLAYVIFVGLRCLFESLTTSAGLPAMRCLPHLRRQEHQCCHV